MSKTNRFHAAALVIAVASFVVAGAMVTPAQAADAKAEAADVVRESTAALKEYFASPRMEAMRNLMGAAQAVYIVPQLKQAALIVGGTMGDGILLRRHGQEWSDPVFLEAKSLNIGFQGGVAELQYVSVIMTDAGVKAVIEGDARVGSGGGVALGTLGVGGGGGGGAEGGVESISFAFSSGAFFGGHVGTTNVSLLDDLNRAVYGADFSQGAVLSGTGGRYAEAVALRALLTEAVKKSWGL